MNDYELFVTVYRQGELLLAAFSRDASKALDLNQVLIFAIHHSMVNVSSVETLKDRARERAKELRIEERIHGLD